ncbi:hypothetical protein PENSTE_c018G02529 [Penicillium steckii]|uniref:Uncharacterized protein n=1 Tax=Penicillium steckii TaxID=303698 RepID=A0A1V6SWC7_9EURO|nr:hypothetical protein PENSTE_c018G02529 [Penicillium steckii]
MSELNKTGPAWGRLLIEQYFILNWDFSSAETPDQQRSRLVFDFLNVNILPTKGYEVRGDLPITSTATTTAISNGIDTQLAEGIGFRQPTSEEIDVILQPYRCQELRWHAMNPYPDKSCPYLLRTYYSTPNSYQRAKDDAQMEEWINTDIFSEEAEWALLDNEDLFKFEPGTGNTADPDPDPDSESWRRIFEIFPELAGPIAPAPCSLSGSQTSNEKRIIKRIHDPMDDIFKGLRLYLKRDLRTAKQSDPAAWLHERNSIIESTGMTLQKIATTTFLFVADKKAFETGNLLVLYLDGLRRVIRQGRVDDEVDDVGSIIGSWMETTDLLEYATLSERYRVDGDLGRELYRLGEVLKDL